MKRVLRLFALTMIVVLALGLMAPAFAQDAIEPLTPNMTVTDGLVAYAADSCDYGGVIQSITATAANQVVFQLCEPDGAFPQKVAFSSLGIQPYEHLQATGGGGEALFRNPVGTGPYALSAWNLGSDVVLTRNDAYWGELANEPTAIFRWTSESAARLNELMAGTVDVIDNVGAGDFETVSANPALQLLPRPALNVFYVGMNNTIAPFDNLNVRQAIAHAIDKNRLVEQFYPPASTTANQFMPPDIFGWTEGFEDTPYDPEAARQLLADSGLELPLEVTINYRDVVRGYLPQPGVVAQDIQAQLADVGINVTIEVMESAAFLDAASAGQLGLFMLGWGADYPDATNFLDAHFGQGANDSFGTKYPEIIDLLNQGSTTSDPQTRLDVYAQVNALIRDNAIMIPVAHGGSALAYKAGITGAHASPLSNESLAVMADPDDDNIILMQNGEPGGIYCADETDGEALRVCEQIMDTLLAYEVGGTAVVPSLAESFSSSEDGLTWTFDLRDATFHDGSAFDANDVVMAYAVQWDAANPLHVGRSGAFDYWTILFKAFLNTPAS
ncbi:MAG: peptide ABC transporter substrate-binding protein [Anaerolineae bacterium]|nr:peptide ABC transporter substrate-binding protein [Anaerolineae bacterium]